MRVPLPATRSTRLLLLLLVVLCAAAAGAGYWYDRNRPWHHFRTVDAGRCYRAGQPAPDDVRTAVRDYGVKTIVNLRPPGEAGGEADWHPKELAATAAAGAAHVDVPLACATPPSPAQIDELLAIFDDAARLPVLIHCEAGSVRSAAVEGLYRLEAMGETNAQVLARVETWGHDLAGEAPQIVAFLRDYVPRRARAGARSRH